MKKFLLSFSVALATMFGMNAQTTLNVNDATDIVGPFVEETLKEDGSVQAAAHYQPLESLVIDGYLFEFSTTNTNASSQPAYYFATSTNTNQQKTIRIYNGTSMTITAPDGALMKNIDFKGSNLGSNGNFTVDAGTWVTDNNANWTGSTNSFTVTANTTWRFSELTITTDKTSSGIDEVFEDVNPIYYNMQGVQVENPENGIFIKKVGTRISKVIIR